MFFKQIKNQSDNTVIVKCKNPHLQVPLTYYFDSFTFPGLSRVQDRQDVVRWQRGYRKTRQPHNLCRNRIRNRNRMSIQKTVRGRSRQHQQDYHQTVKITFLSFLFDIIK